MKLLVAVTLVATVLAGCIEPGPSVPDPQANLDVPAILPVEVLEWSGHVVTSQGEVLLHVRPSEDLLWPVEQEGILVEVAEGTSALEVALSWDGPGRFMIMLHSHKGTTGYIEHITKLDGVNPKCLRVPAADVTPGHWQVMVHSNDALDTDFTLTVLTQGAETKMLDERHGHQLTERNTIDVHDIEPCTLQAPA